MTSEYIAGLFDGEGYFTFRRCKVNKRYTVREWRFQIYAHITLREGWLLDETINVIGAGTCRAFRKQNDKWSQCYIATWSGKSLSRFIDKIGPHIIAKRQQRDLVIEILEIKNRIGNKPVSNDDYIRQEEIWSLMKGANMKGVGKPKPMDFKGF